MSKSKNKLSKRSTSIPNKILYSRVSYLYQAAVYLATIRTPHHHQQQQQPKDEVAETGEKENPTSLELEMVILGNERVNAEDTDVNVAAVEVATGLASASAAAAAAVLATKIGSCINHDDKIMKYTFTPRDGEKEEEKNTSLEVNSCRVQNLSSSLNPTNNDTINGSRRLISELRNISLKTQIRLSPHIKHSICKTCFTLMIDGSTCSNFIENKSKGGRKPWADTLVKKCNTCSSEKRFPLSAQRQKRREARRRNKYTNFGNSVLA